MYLIKIFIFVETLLIFLIAIKKNNDLFSPVKFYLLFSTFFYIKIYFKDVQNETLICYFLLIQIVGICALIENNLPSKVNISNISSLFFEKVLWILTFPPLIIICYYIYDAGGLLEYLGILASRVKVWSGQGPQTMVINWMPTLNLVYFSYIILNKDESLLKKLRYGLHFVLFIIIGLLTASRSNIGICILGMIFVLGYVKGRPKIQNIIFVALLLVAFAGFIGGVRNTYGVGMSFDSLVNSFTESKFENAQLAYGIDPLEVIFTAPEKPPILGSTYLTLATNLIPRHFWPNKPDTGGIIFTEKYTDDQSGLSYYATGAITEGIMNFGQVAGLIFGICEIFVFFISGSLAYNKYFFKWIKNG